jgi:nucleoid DNA-binding protein
MELLCETLSEALLLTDEQVQQFLDAFFEKIPHFLRKSMQIQQAA